MIGDALDGGLGPQKRELAHGMMYFAWPLPVAGEVLGINRRIVIGGHSLEVFFPRRDGGSPLLVEPLRSDGSKLPYTLSPQRDTVHWGSHYGEDLYKVSKVGVAAEFAVEGDGNLSTSDLVKFQGAYRAWFPVVRDWLSLWTGVPQDDLPREVSSALRIKTERSVPSGISAAGITVHVHSDVRGASLIELLAAFRKGSQGEAVSLAYRLLIEANKAYLQGDFRRAVIDGGSAVEVAFAESIGQSLKAKGVDDEVVTRIIGHANGVVGLAALCRDLGISPAISQNKIRDEFASTRNRAVHKGTDPSNELARKIVRYAQNLVFGVLPVPFAQTEK